jgi:glycosyltransferase involved in cell wall biosynthesis
MPRVSVIVPTYNCARFLVESLDSILAQTVPPDEIVVVDDGSTDDTSEIVARYANRLTIVHGQHGGLSAARNLGLAHAHGDWIAFHDADDIALPDRLAFQLDFLEQNPHDAVFCNGARMDASAPVPPRLITPSTAAQCSGRRLTAAHLFEGYPVYFQGALVSRAAFSATGEFDVSLRVQPDIEYGYRLFARARATFVDRVVFSYRWHTTNNSGDRLGGREDIARILEHVDRLDPQAVRAIGKRRLRLRLARHYYRIARSHLERGDAAAARAAITRALELRPLSPRYQMLRLRHARALESK